MPSILWDLMTYKFLQILKLFYLTLVSFSTVGVYRTEDGAQANGLRDLVRM